MKYAIFLVLSVSGYCYGQDNEFKTCSNGLISDEATMNKLGAIVDSLNIKFRTCDLSHPYYACPQGIALWVEIPTATARKLIVEGISPEDYRNKYPRSVKKQKLWIIKNIYTDYEGKEYIEYSGLPYGWSSEPTIYLAYKKANDKSSGWIVNKESTMAFYIQKLETQQLPFDYARLVQYVDCLIDTSAEIYFPQAKAEVYQRVQEDSKAHKFIAWASSFPNEPTMPEYDKIEKPNLNFDSIYTNYYKERTAWDSLRLLHLDQQMKISHYWKSLLMEAVDESVPAGNSSAELEFYVARYLSKQDALKLMRSRKVIGGCSQDRSPRYHAMNICMLAAETTQWDIFLRSHLDIMNDRFERVSDGSYAWAGRKTYLKELEELDINAIDLLLGTSLRVKNVSANHYWGSIGRVGRALADASDKDALEIRLLSVMEDEELDPFNRLLIAYLFDNYNHNLEDESRKRANNQKLRHAINAMPEYVSEVWKKE